MPEKRGEQTRLTVNRLLAHHPPTDYHRCYRLPVGETPLHLCSRCTGIYPGLLIGIILVTLHTYLLPLSIIAILGLPLIIEKIGEHNGFTFSNPIRTTSGFLVGLGYSHGIAFLWTHPTSISAYLVGGSYLIVGGMLIWKTASLPDSPLG